MMGRGPKHMLASSASLWYAVIVGICCTYFSPAVERLRPISLNASETGISIVRVDAEWHQNALNIWISSALPLGAIFGALAAGYLAGRIGRKIILVGLSMFLLGGWLLILHAEVPHLVYCGRFILGICCGVICAVAPMYIVEIVPPSMRGYYACQSGMYTSVGMILASFSLYTRSRFVAAAGTVLSVFCPILMSFMPESPVWLLQRERHAEAAASVQFLYGDKDETRGDFIYYDYKESQEKKISYDLKHPTIYKPLLYSICLMFFQQFSGFNAVLYYTPLIFEEAKLSVEPAFQYVIIAHIMFNFGFYSCQLVDKLGRKLCLIISALTTFSVLNLLSIYLFFAQNNPALKEPYGWNLIPLFCMVVYVGGYSLGLGPVPWLMMSEMAPAHARSMICGAGTAASWLFWYLVTGTTCDLEPFVHDYASCFFYSLFCLLCCFFALRLPETKGKTFYEIQRIFSGEGSLVDATSGGDNILLSATA